MSHKREFTFRLACYFVFVKGNSNKAQKMT